MKPFKRIIACLILTVSVLLSNIIISASAADSVTVKLIASALKAEPGDRFSVSYSFTNASDFKYGLTAFTGILKYDETKVKCVKVTHSTFNNSIMTSNRNLTGEVRTLYTYANLNKKPGVNSDAAFVTYEFAVLNDSPSGNATFTLDFDTVVTTDYDKSPAENITLSYNKPTFTVEIINPNSAASSKADADNASSQASTSSKQPSDKAPDNTTTVDDKYLNPDFTDKNVADGEEQIFDTADGSQIESQLTESVNNMLSSTYSEAGIDPDTISNGNSDANSGGSHNILKIVLIAVGVIIVAGAIVGIILVNKKNKAE